MGKRHNIDTIAEILIDKLDAMEKTAAKIDAASRREMKLDVEDLQELLKKQHEILRQQLSVEKSILSDFKELKEKNKARLPNWALVVLFVLFLACGGMFVYSLKKAEGYDLQKMKAEHFEEKYLKLKREKQ